MPTEFEIISKQLDKLSEQFEDVTKKINEIDKKFEAHLAHYTECKTACHLHSKVLFGNGDGEKGIQYKVIELMKWKGLQRKIFWTLLVPILTANAGLFGLFAKSYFYPDKSPNTPVVTQSTTKGP